MNEHDSLKIKGLLCSLGFQETKEQEKANLILFNTCTIRQKAHDKAFSEIGKAIVLKNATRTKYEVRSTIARIIAVCGCMAQEEGAKLLHRFPEIDLIFGPDQIHKLPELLTLVEKESRPAVAAELINSPEEYHFLDAVPALRLHACSAYVTIMKGCNSRCSYCIVPQVRGTEVYRPVRDIIREVEFLAERGCKEVVLLGQNVNSYYKDGVSFAGLIRRVSDNTGIARMRFTSPHPKDVKEDLIQEYAENFKLCPHIHLPLQSGSDSVLKRMRRAYNTKTYRAKAEALRKARPDIAISTDMIVGFPGETDEEFQQTLDFVREIEFDGMYAFQYSPRPGTEAWDFKDDVEKEQKKERLRILLEVQNEISKKRNEICVGKVEEVLVEGPDKRKRGKWTGKNPQNKSVNFSGQGVPIGAIVKVRITKGLANSLEGEREREIWEKRN